MRSAFLAFVVGLFCFGPLSPAAPPEPLPQPPPEPRYKLVLQSAPASPVNSVAVSPDGSLVATAAGEGGVRLYDA